MSKIQKWKLLSTKDVSPSNWLPVESRRYELPSGKVIEDFTVTTLADVSMIVPVTKNREVVVVRQYKPGIDQITLEFPAGRMEPHHTDFEETAIHELEEETGILVEKYQLHFLGTSAGFVTKGSEKIYNYVAFDVEFNSEQKFDELEEIEVETYPIAEFEERLLSESPVPSSTAIAWMLAKTKFPEIFSKK